MKFGIGFVPTDYSISPGRLAAAAEYLGFESIFFPEHTHVPVERVTPWSRGVLERKYYHSLDPFVALSFAASATSSIRIGTGICLLSVRDPIIVAKAVSTLDALSGGRFLFGLGVGWNREEIENHGINPDRRWKVFDDKLDAIRRIWSEDKSEVSSTYVSFSSLYSWPKPTQVPHPTLLLGSAMNSSNLRRMMGSKMDWFPTDSRREVLEESIQWLSSECAALNVDPPAISVYCLERESLEAPSIERYIDMGVERLVIGIPSGESENESMRDVKSVADLVADYL